jgi:3-dehydroquinate synthase
VCEPLRIASHVGPYDVSFETGRPFAGVADAPGVHWIVDARVATLYRQELQPVLTGSRVLLIEATEQAKSLERCPAYVEHLLASGLRRDHVIVAIGGGVVQDIACFLAAVVLRGVRWEFSPTTLLAQADSCIGSKSSINVGAYKNIVGTFTPPAQVIVNPAVLRTLDDVEIRSGIGEMLKVHAIDSPTSFDRIAADCERLTTDDDVLLHYIRASLRMKQRLIELDEFDRGDRRVMNYGHSFGHAIESATAFAVPHGIAVTVGMDLANHVAAGLGISTVAQFERMHRALMTNAAGFETVPVSVDALLGALAKDKKNAGAATTLVLPDADGRIHLRVVANDMQLRNLCAGYFEKVRTG